MVNSKMKLRVVKIYILNIINYDLSDDLGIPSASFNNEPLILRELPDDEYCSIVQTLNKEQKEFFLSHLAPN